MRDVVNRALSIGIVAFWAVRAALEPSLGMAGVYFLAALIMTALLFPEGAACHRPPAEREDER